MATNPPGRIFAPIAPKTPTQFSDPIALLNKVALKAFSCTCLLAVAIHPYLLFQSPRWCLHGKSQCLSRRWRPADQVDFLVKRSQIPQLPDAEQFIASGGQKGHRRHSDTGGLLHLTQSGAMKMPKLNQVCSPPTFDAKGSMKTGLASLKH
jgi:hypothetical protein